MAEDSLNTSLNDALGRAGAAQNRWAERIRQELSFTRQLATLHPEHADEWEKLIRQATRTVVSALASPEAVNLPKAVREAERVLKPIAKVAGQYTVHCVAHAHIDMDWMWSWPETVAITNDTFTTVLKLMEEFDDLCFVQSQASVYRIIQRYNPELLEQIKRRVAEGRWEPAAVHWVEGDKNMASGQSLARHMLYSRRYMKELFDLEPEDMPLDWEPDTFGHARTIPSIVSAGAVKYYYMCRGGPAQKPPVYWWKGPDGKRILVYLDDINWYLGPIDAIGPTEAKVADALIKFCRKTGLKQWMNVYGVGDHGGGPTRRDIERAHEMDGWPVFPSFRLGGALEYYRYLEENGDELPVLDGEMNFEFDGCYTSQSRIKHANRLGEGYCLEGEVAGLLGHAVLGRDYPADELREAWINVLFGHFHDILPGSCIEASRQRQRARFQETAATTGMIKTQALRGIAAKIDTAFSGQADGQALPENLAMGGGPGHGAMLDGMSDAGHSAGRTRPFVVFNLTPSQQEDVVTAVVWDPQDSAGDKAKDASYIVRGPDGEVIPAQKTDEGNYWFHDYVELAFPTSVGPVGYAAHAIEPAEEPLAAEEGRCRLRTPRVISNRPAGIIIENERLEVAFDQATGGIARLIDKQSGLDLADPAHPLAVLEYLIERPTGGSAWTRNTPWSPASAPRVGSLRPGKKGPHIASVVMKGAVADSNVKLEYVLKAGCPWLELRLEVEWREIGGKEKGIPALQIRFPFNVEDARARYEVPYGSIERSLKDGEEVPALRWADITGKAPDGARAAGCALLNDCKYGHSLDGSALRLTLIRSSYDPDPLPEVRNHEIRMALLPHDGTMSIADMVRRGAAFSHPLQVIATDVHEGDLPACAAAIRSVEPDNVVLATLKGCEDGDGVICRLYNLSEQDSTARVVLDEQLLGIPAEAVEVDMLERPLPDSSAEATSDGFSVRVPPNGIAGVKLTYP